MLDDADPVNARVTAVNTIGSSATSASGNGAALPVATAPGAPTGLTRNAATSKTQASLTWTAPSDDGTSSIVDYLVEHDQGSGSWMTGSANVVGTGYTQEGLSTGISYKFRVSARNAVGHGTPSDEFTIITAVIPSQPGTPATALNGSNIDITWAAPSDLGGVALDYYTIEIQKADLSWSTETTHCDGSDSTIISTAACSIPLATLSTTHSLTTGDSVTVRVTAVNAIGPSQISSEGDGATVP